MENMEILKAATDWAKAEVFSSTFFIIFGIMFALASIGFWQLGKSDMAKAYIIPTLVAGILLLTVGVGIFYANKSRVTSFAKEYKIDSKEFVKTEIIRTEKTIAEYNLIVFKIIPLLIASFSLIIIFFDKTNLRASLITSIAMLVMILLVDSNAKSRLESYNNQLSLQVEQVKD